MQSGAGNACRTEAEWERAARGAWHWHTMNADTANYGENVGDTTPVGTYPPDASGLYDMAGNVWEWCLDEYNPDFLRYFSKIIILLLGAL